MIPPQDRRSRRRPPAARPHHTLPAIPTDRPTGPSGQRAKGSVTPPRRQRDAARDTALLSPKRGVWGAQPPALVGWAGGHHCHSERSEESRRGGGATANRMRGDPESERVPPHPNHLRRSGGFRGCNPLEEDDGVGGRAHYLGRGAVPGLHRATSRLRTRPRWTSNIHLALAGIQEGVAPLTKILGRAGGTLFPRPKAEAPSRLGAARKSHHRDTNGARWTASPQPPAPAAPTPSAPHPAHPYETASGRTTPPPSGAPSPGSSATSARLPCN
jgi:hypothetical protein